MPSTSLRTAVASSASVLKLRLKVFLVDILFANCRLTASKLVVVFGFASLASSLPSFRAQAPTTPQGAESSETQTATGLKEWMAHAPADIKNHELFQRLCKDLNKDRIRPFLVLSIASSAGFNSVPSPVCRLS